MQVNTLEVLDHPSEEQAIEAARQYLSLESYLRVLSRNLENYARDHDGFAYGGQEVNGKTSGGLFLYNQRTVYEMVPNQALVAEALIELIAPKEKDNLELREELTHWLEKCRTDWYMSDLRKHSRHPEIMRKIAEYRPEDGGLEQQMAKEASFAIRKSPPGPGSIVEPVESGLEDE